MRQIKIFSVVAAAILATGFLASLPPIPQDAAYHLFADDKTGWGLRNTANVLSNIAFVIAGLAVLKKVRKLPLTPGVLMWWFFSCSIAFTGLGSAYYHWQPANHTLFWDRLPMTLAFTSLTACVCAERLSVKTGRLLFIPLVAGGVLSVVYWWLSEQAGAGDLRPYILVQYLPMVLIPLMVLLFPQGSQADRPYWLLMASYIIAKGFELNDAVLFNLTNQIISGHTLKHLAAAAGIMMFRPPVVTEANIGDHGGLILIDAAEGRSFAER